MKKSLGKNRISIFIDAANIFYSQKTLGWRVDYEKFLSYWKEQGKAKGAYFYTAVISTKQKQLKFFHALGKLGYTVITREVKVIRDRKNKKIIQKGNFDVKLAIDLVLKAKEFDIAVLGSGDSDFEPAVEYLRSINKKIIIVSARGHVARELIKRANSYLPLQKLKEKIKRP
ncbi:MAG: NYN domain-containing protein [Candidatus Levybacteria bacterium]|nr:NYN domain-containing protein [Candidatus Levybacteria bacterium]